jgi:predicted phage terminase large subunit-like protein
MIDIPSSREIQKALDKKKLESSLYDYLLFLFEKIKKEEFLESWHHKSICDVLIKVYKGELTYVIINLPPRYTKTEIVIKAFVSWCIAKNPKSKFIHLSYSDDLALDNSSAIREIIKSDEFQDFWPINIKQDSDSKKKWYTENGGGVYATSTGGQITGFGAGLVQDPDEPYEFGGAILIDDPLKPDDASSDTIRLRMNQRFNNTIKSRVNSNRTPIIIIMQRLHEDDMAGFLLNGGSEFDFFHLNLPALNEDGPSEYDPREVGEALWPAKHTEEDLEAMRVADANTFAGQYQQRPSPEEGNIFKWFYYYKELPPLNYKILSWDFTFKKGKNTDYVVGTCWGRCYKGDYYLIDLVRAKMSFTETLDSVKLFALKHPDYKACLIEEKANGSAIMDSIKEEIKRVIAINPTESKEERAEAVAPLYRGKNVFLPDPVIAPWINDFVNEHKNFPNGKHDDQVDSSTQALDYLDGLSTGKSLKDVNPKQEPFRVTFNKEKKNTRENRIKVNNF